MRVLISAMAAALFVSGCDRGSAPTNLDKPAPEFAIADGSHSVDLAKLRGHVVLVNLWASWCAPCIDELPSLLELQHAMPGVTVVAISMDQDDAAYKAFLQRNNVDLLTVRDPDGRIQSLYGTAQIPETYVVDKNGILRRKFISEQDWMSPEIQQYLHKLGA